jgi:hypothetical protein
MAMSREVGANCTRAFVGMGSCVLAIALCAAGSVALAQRPTFDTRTIQRDRGGAVTTLRVRRTDLPADARIGRQVRVREGTGYLLRRTTVDSPVRSDGRFTRTTRTVVVQPRDRGTALRRPANEYAPQWSRRDAPYLYTAQRLGPIPRTNAVELRLFAPNAAASSSCGAATASTACACGPIARPCGARA